jgi:predicted methyltransferase
LLQDICPAKNWPVSLSEQIVGPRILASLVLAVSGTALAAVQQPPDARLALRSAIASPTRTEANRARDRYRHPYETLTFFGVKPGDTVVEIWPGGGWYTEILAPYLRSGGGKLVWATPAGDTEGLEALKARDAALFGSITVADFPGVGTAAKRVPDGTVDVVLTFRNVHNWLMDSEAGNERNYASEAFKQMYAMLKPGGVLGIVDHRLPESASNERERTTGYVKVSTVKRLAREAGFRLLASSEINANPRDSSDWPKGVWTLPPALALGGKDRAKYLAIGESDRMTLKFVKPR